MSTPRVGAAGVMALALFTATACGDTSEGGQEMSVWMYQDTLVVVQEGAVDRYNEGSDVEAAINEVPGDNYEERLRTAMGSSEQPDVFFNWGSGSIQPYVEQDMLAPLDDALADDPEFADAFLPAVMEAGEVDGSQYGIPLRGTQPVILFYNEAVFEEVGAEPPETWDDILDLIDVFTAEDVLPFALGGADNWTQLMWLQYLLDRIGGPEVFNSIEAGDSEGWRDPAVLESAETIADLVDRGAFGDAFASVSFTEGAASTLLSDGRAAMHLMGSWEYSTHLDQDEEFAENDLNYAAFPPMPDGEGDPSNVVGNPTNYFSVSSDTDYHDESVDFLKETAEDEYVQDMVDNGEVPTTANAEDVLEDSPNPDFATFQYEMVRDAGHFQLSWDQALPPDVATPMLTEVESLFSGQVTPEEFVDNLADL